VHNLGLTLVSAIALGMICMANTETMTGNNFRDEQVAFFAMRAGLEEAHERMRKQGSASLTLPTTMPGSPNSILYITNPSNNEIVDPTNSSNAYFDNEFCHESFTGLTSVSPGVPCSHAQGPPSGSVSAYVNSFDPGTGTATSLNYKWVRITLKQNGTIYNLPVDPGQPASTQICYQSLARREIPLSHVPGGSYANCAVAQADGMDASPVYILTSLAMTPSGSRRMGQYEVAGLSLDPPLVALGRAGCHLFAATKLEQLLHQRQ
jgi:hypothetical protein